MTRKTTCIVIVAVANLILFPLTLGFFRQVSASDSGALLFDCCQESVDGDGFCCDDCCIFSWNCLMGTGVCGNR